MINEKDPDGDGSAYTYTSDSDGKVNFGENLKPNTLYCWIETAFPTGYLEDTATKHYFVIYYEEQLEEGQGSAEGNRESAWELGDMWEDQYDIIVASISDGTVWVATNSKTRTIRVTKAWSGDYDNAYKTRPESVKINLIQIDYQGNRSVYATTNLTTGNDGKWNAYTNYSWTNLPAMDDEGNLYTYTVEEEAVSGYYTTYSDDQAGVKTGSITVRNTLIPSKTDIYAEKVWKGDDTTDRPASITVQLLQILTDSDGNTGAPTVYGDPVRMLQGADGRWTASWTDLPTKDGTGGTYTYTVKEVEVPDGYAVAYSDKGNGVLSASSDNPLTITNTALGSLKISKTFTGLDASRLTAEQKQKIVFTITDSDGKEAAEVTYADMTNSSITISNLPAGEYTITETGADALGIAGYGLSGTTFSVTDGKTTVLKGTTSEVNVVNEYTKTLKLSIEKEWQRSDGVEIQEADIAPYSVVFEIYRVEKQGVPSETTQYVFGGGDGNAPAYTDGNKIGTYTLGVSNQKWGSAEGSYEAAFDSWSATLENLAATGSNTSYYQYVIVETFVESADSGWEEAGVFTPAYTVSEVDGVTTVTAVNIFANDSGVVLPSTGGIGTKLLRDLGLALIVIAACGFVFVRRIKSGSGK